MKKLLPAVLALTAMTQAANAFVVTVEPDDYALGTDLSTVSPYVTLQHVLSSTQPIGEFLDTWPVHSVADVDGDGLPSPSPTGDRSFGRAAFIQYGPDDQIFSSSGLGLFFNVPVVSASLIARNFYNYSVGTYWRAFDSQGSLVGSGLAGYGAQTGQTYLIDIVAPNMASVILGVDDGSATASYDHLVLSIDDRYAIVPEPAPLALLAGGLAGLVINRRRRQGVRHSR